MSWFQQPNNSWQVAEAEADADMLAGRMGQQNRVIAKWRAHAEQLQKALDNMYLEAVNKAGAAAGQAALKDAALNEIVRLDPTNKLLDPAYRKAIYDTEKAKLEKDLQEKNAK